MEAIRKREIEAIYPLTTMQQRLLFHHLTSDEDSGFLHVQCMLNGNLDIELFKSSWHKAVERHSILRTSVHWKKIEKPVQLVRPNSEMKWTVHDWSGISNEKQKLKLKALKEEDRKRGIDLEKGPLTKIDLAKANSQTFYLLWQCHHLLLDGWSSSIILQDVMKFYNAFYENREAKLETIPTYKSFLNWSQKVPKYEAISFWKSELANFKPIPLFVSQKTDVETRIETCHLELSLNESESLREIAKKAHITTNTMFIGIWTLILSRYFRIDDMILGTTVSGRSSDFPNIHLMAGMFMNVLPVRSKIDSKLRVADWLRSVQDQQQKARKYEDVAIEDILTEIDWPISTPLFESLFVFENFPLKDISADHLELKDFKSGVTTTYPLTLVVKPGPCFAMDIVVESDKIATENHEWFQECFKQIVREITTSPESSVASLLNRLDEPLTQEEKVDLGSPKKTLEKNYVSARTPVESQLVDAWEKAFGFGPIGVKDNFFELGGKSMLALKLFSELSQTMKMRLSPTMLYDHQTISELSKYVSTNTKESRSWDYLVEIRSKGKQAPLFCLHTGGSHFFFYNLLAKNLNPDRPIYALHASGVKNEVKLHRSVEEMASDFVDEIKKVQPNGPYHIMAYCFSTAVGLEIARILNQKSDHVHYIVVDTSSINQNLYAISKTGSRIFRISKAFLKNPVKTVKRAVGKRMEFYVKPAFDARFGNEDQKRVASLRTNNVKIYQDYKWQSFDGNISLLLTEKSYNPNMNGFIVDSWEKIAEEGLKIIHMKGHHYTLFSEPDVTHTAEILENCMEEFEADNK